MRGMPMLQDNATDQQIAARHVAVEVDRDIASSLGISLSAIDQTLYDDEGNTVEGEDIADDSNLDTTLQEADDAAVSRTDRSQHGAGV